jgi:DNA polymerase-3 subunit delta'
VNFNDIPGLYQQKKYLKDLVSQDRLPHAFIFTGPEGNGKLSLAIALASFIQCESRTESACGACPACIKSKKIVHPDIHFVYPVIKKEGKKREDTVSTDFLVQWRQFISNMPYGSISDWLDQINAESKPANINTTECNQISSKLGLKSFEGSHKILIVWHAEMLGKDGNRLLKIIEEPPESTIIILIAERLDKIIKTITSRCQIFAVPPFTDEDIASVLTEKSTGPVDEIIQLADGNMQQALSLINKGKSNYSEEILDWMRIAYRLKAESVVSWLDDFNRKSKQDQANFLLYGLYYMKEYRKILLCQDINQGKLTNSEKQVAHKMAKLVDEEMSAGIVALFENTLGFLRRNANAKILFMDMTIRLQALMKREHPIV